MPVKLHYIEPTPPEQRPVYQAIKKWRQDMAASKDIYPENFLPGCGISQKFIRDHGAAVVCIFKDDYAKTLASLNSD